MWEKCMNNYGNSKNVSAKNSEKMFKSNKMPGRVGNWRRSRDYTKYMIVKIGQNTAESPGT